MVIVLVIAFVALVVMASEITRAVFSPWMFVTVVIGEIVAIEAIYTKQLICAAKTALAAMFGARFKDSKPAREIKKGTPSTACPFVLLYSAATTASPISTVPTFLQSGVTMSPVR
jgi:uncharacterized membrane protein AbrB (regulator of aidB expression)